ncbi:hypothetical protein [Lactobacillus sp. PV034]|uniref:hypothetical protein n=1 Tax=Lactobacillus sp. PV034 TaxID=2594495 RepID=UPI00224055AD|nr:hypothetical protein [Lactobacillus sp. PV034]QNQ80801.1 hypothetical protein FP432_04150 [Lactobacillus sp. PV034]
MDEIRIVFWEKYRGRNILIKKFYPSDNMRGWFTGYVQLLSEDNAKYPIMANDSQFLSAFDPFPGGMTFLDQLQVVSDNDLYAGFDTMHWGMEHLNVFDCVKALKQTIDNLNK